tara:strand:+ start:261 stop:611 length:351 start_codon:yes stop_codon:yes gene_type:complete
MVGRDLKATQMQWWQCSTQLTLVIFGPEVGLDRDKLVDVPGVHVGVHGHLDVAVAVVDKFRKNFLYQYKMKTPSSRKRKRTKRQHKKPSAKRARRYESRQRKHAEKKANDFLKKKW